MKVYTHFLTFKCCLCHIDLPCRAFSSFISDHVSQWNHCSPPAHFPFLHSALECCWFIPPHLTHEPFHVLSKHNHHLPPFILTLLFRLNFLPFLLNGLSECQRRNHSIIGINHSPRKRCLRWNVRNCPKNKTRKHKPRSRFAPTTRRHNHTHSTKVLYKHNFMTGGVRELGQQDAHLLPLTQKGRVS